MRTRDPCGDKQSATSRDGWEPADDGSCTAPEAAAPGAVLPPSAIGPAVAGALGRMMAHRDTVTARHHTRVAALAVGIARSLALTGAEIDTIRLGALLHDIGKIGVPLSITNKTDPLSLHELRLLQGHPVVGEEILEGIDFGGPVGALVRQHHERLDGSGYPDGLERENILLGARIVAVADVLESMVTDRPYRRAPGLEAAMTELHRGRGIMFDPAAVDACLSLCRDPSVLAVLAGGVQARSQAALDDRPHPPQLTLQQMAVMRLLADGRSTKEIARTLDLGLGTVKTHLSRAYATLGAGNRVAALRAAGLLEPGGR